MNLRDVCLEMKGRWEWCGALQCSRGVQAGSPGWGPGLRPRPPSQVRFSRPESEQARQRRVQSYEFLQRKHAEEPWVHLHYYGLRVSRGPRWRLTLAPGRGPGRRAQSHLELVVSDSVRATCGREPRVERVESWG